MGRLLRRLGWLRGLSRLRELLCIELLSCLFFRTFRTAGGSGCAMVMAMMARRGRCGAGRGLIGRRRLSR